MKQGELLWIQFPYSNLTESKVRPAVIVSNDSYNQQNQDIVVCAITSNLKETPYSLPLENHSLTQGQLTVQSRIRADKILQINKQLALKSFGRINDKTYDRLIAKIKTLVERK
ncbi:MAG: type II toxin-antitoxin system PemK/MazF family toxin [Nanoarchaeota archaeon]